MGKLSEDKSEESDIGSGSGSDSDLGYGRKGRGKKGRREATRRSTRAKRNRYDDDFICEGSDSEEIEKKDKRRSKWSESEQSDSDSDYGRKKKKKGGAKRGGFKPKKTFFGGAAPKGKRKIKRQDFSLSFRSCSSKKCFLWFEPSSLSTSLLLFLPPVIRITKMKKKSYNYVCNC